MDKRKVTLLVSIAAICFAVLFYGLYRVYGTYAYSVALAEMKERVNADVQKSETKEIELTAKSIDSQLSEPIDIETGVKSEGEKYILLLGLDTRGTDLVGRSDSMLLLKLDKSKNKIILISIPRDSYVKIIGKGISDKITHAFAYGGKEMSQATVESLFGIEIDNTVVINFRSFENVIDILGGVVVNSPFAFDEQAINSKERIYIKKGKQRLTGREALAYARMRKQDPKGDFGRGERQQEVIESALNSLKTVNDAGTLKKLYKEIDEKVDTDLSVLDALDYYPYVKSFMSDNRGIEKHQVSGVGTKINGIYYDEIDKSKLNELRKLLHGGEIQEKETIVQEDQEEELPVEVTEAPETYNNEKAYKATGSSVKVKSTPSSKHKSMEQLLIEEQERAQKEALKNAQSSSPSKTSTQVNLIDEIHNQSESELKNSN